ncbi:hypothetical protein DM992_39180 [Burkholderia sp. JP2-270]|nr:hypothetical protein DM992_39180 [Burkholderia sp. JP2-270]
MADAGCPRVHRHQNATVLHGSVVRGSHTEDLIGLPVSIIGVFCALEVLIEREWARGDRKIGLAESQFHSIHANRHYDYVVDTSLSNSSECGQLGPE